MEIINNINSPHFLAFYNRLQKVYKQLQKIAAKRNITCYRLYDKDMPEHPLIIDIYNKNVVVYEYESKHKLSDEDYNHWHDTCINIIKDILQIDDTHLHCKTRRRKKDRENQYQKIDERNEYDIVIENGLQFYTNYHDFLDTGLFLDHRITRKMVQAISGGKRVLNLFCYTGSFSIYAAAGGASEVWSLDLSNTYIDWGKRNDALNNSNANTKMYWNKCDVLQDISKLPKNYFDIVILDPPTFSNSKMMKSFWDVQQHHTNLLNDIHNIVSENGTIFFSNNAKQFVLDESVNEKWHIKNLTKQTTDFDFEGKLNRVCFKLDKKN
jgi:23S rRNA (cytosine1962-C5)-methyltransferase